MKEYCLELVSQKTQINDKINIMREYLQAYALRVFHDRGMFRSMAFVGGTALRFLHGLPRFSEDLDFSLVRQDPRFSISGIMAVVRNEFVLAGYDAGVSYNDAKTVKSAFVKFEGLLKEAGISPLESRKLSIKIEIDTNPPEGAMLITEIVNKYFPLSFLSYDTPSLFAGKLHALLSRKYLKGRDFFDVGWYLSKWKELTPNIVLLQNALLQTGWKKERIDETNWRRVIRQYVKAADWNKVEADVRNFLDRPSDSEVFSKEVLIRLLGNGGKEEGRGNG
jgi:predicted nucleotidyltransferase component of viral defense system